MSKRKLLLADDSLTIQKVVNLTFADEGIEVITVGDGDSAMEKWSETAPDLVLADVHMPGLNGYEVCEKIKQSKNLRKTPVILLVGSFEPFDETEAERVGADGFLTKPFQSIRQLVGKVTQLLAPVNNVENTDLTESAAPLGDDSFADTQEFVPSDYAPLGEENVQFGDVAAGMDDEMIQTNYPASGFALNELAKFETKEIFEPVEEEVTAENEEREEIEAEDAAEIDALADDPEKLILQSSAFDEAETRTIDDTSAASQADSILGSDENDLLELPFIENETNEERGSSAAARITPGYEVKNQVTRKSGALRKAVDISSSGRRRRLSSPTETEQLSPETIDAIAEQVAEKISDKVIREIAEKVVPQLADLIVRKMSEKKPD